MKVETYTIEGWKEKVTGIVLDENDNWILINEVPVDYLPDGFSLINKNHLSKRKTTKLDQQTALVLKLKKYKPELAKKFKFGSVSKMTKWIENQYGLIQFQDEHEDSLEIGVVDRIKKNTMNLLFLKTNGKFVKKYTYEYEIDKIRKISFDSDYLYSLSLLITHNYKEEK